MEKDTKIIIGPLNVQEKDKIFNFLINDGFTPVKGDSGNAISIARNHVYVGDFDRYARYRVSNKIDYGDRIYMSPSEFIARYIDMTATPVKENKPSMLERAMNQVDPKFIDSNIPCKDNEVPIITYGNLHNAYNNSNKEIKLLLEQLYGSEIFAEPTYKIGDKFRYKDSNDYVIIRINTSVISLIDTISFTNFSKSITVRDVNKISKKELKDLMGIYYVNFKLIK